jgi:formate dehydrogenase major subunit
MQQSFGTGAATNSIVDIDYTDCMMVVGANPTSAHPVTGAKIKQRAMKGKTLIVIDPVKTVLAELADYHLQLRPGTNVALLNMMQFFIVEAGLVDHDFVQSRCEDYDELVTQLQQLDMAKLEALTGVPVATVKAAALAYARANNAMSFHGLGVTEHSQGAKTVMLITNLAMMTGNIGRAGVGVNPLRGQNNVQGAADMGCQPHQGAGYFEMDSPEIQTYYANAYGVPSPTVAGKKIPEMFNGMLDGSMKALWVMGEDIAQTDPNTHHVIAALSQLDLLVVQELFITETAKLAHVVLPATSFLEKSGTFTNGERRIQRVKEAVPPLAGTKSDGQIMVDIMNRMGYAQPDYAPDTMLEEISQVVPFFAGVTWENLGENGLQWPVQKGGIDTKILHTETFKRGKGKFHHFDFAESTELLDNAAEYPFILTTSRDLVHYNAGTMTRRTYNSEIVDKDVLLINPIDAAKKNINTGDITRLFSDRGEVELLAEVSEKVKAGVLFTTFHFPENMVNNITSNVCDGDTLCPEYKVVAADVERVAV